MGDAPGQLIPPDILRRVPHRRTKLQKARRGIATALVSLALVGAITQIFLLPDPALAGQFDTVLAAGADTVERLATIASDIFDRIGMAAQATLALFAGDGGERGASPERSALLSQLAAAGLAQEPPLPETPPPFPPATGSTSSPQATIVNQYITQPVIERVVEQASPQTLVVKSGVSEQTLAEKLQELAATMNTRIQNAFIGAARSAIVESISNVTVSGVTGLTDADIPDGLTASNYLLLTGGTLTGGLTLPEATTTASIYLTDITAPANTTNRLYADSGDLYWVGSVIGGATTGQWTTDGTNVWRAGGSVGIGTASPSNLLHVESTNDGATTDYIRLKNLGQSVNTAASMLFTTRDAGGASISTRLQSISTDVTSGSGDADFAVLVTRNGALQERFRFTSTGNVGIGTTSPATKLQVYSGTATDIDLLTLTVAGNVATGRGPGILFQSPGGSGTAVDAARISTPLSGASSNNADILFSSRTSSALTDKMIITSAGNVGIGTTSPGTKLHVRKGSAGLGYTMTDDGLAVENSGNAYLTLYSPDADESGIRFASPSDSAGAVLKWDHDDNLMRLATANNGDSLAFSSGNAVEAMRVDSSGNVGVATTSPWRNLSVTGTVGFDGLGSSGGTQTLCLTDNKEVVTNDGACTASSEALKHGITSLSLSGADIVSGLKPSAFTYNNAERETWGFIAEDLAAIDPHFIGYFDPESRPRTINTTAILAAVVKAIQELIAKVTSFATSFASDEITANKRLCVEDVCVTRDQFLRMVEQSDQQPAQVSPSPEAASSAPAFEPSSGVASAADQEATATSTPDSTESDSADDTATATTPAAEEPVDTEEVPTDDDDESADAPASGPEPTDVPEQTQLSAGES